VFTGGDGPEALFTLIFYFLFPLSTDIVQGEGDEISRKKQLMIMVERWMYSY
jgi:hypothetical protein